MIQRGSLSGVGLQPLLGLIVYCAAQNLSAHRKSMWFYLLLLFPFIPLALMQTLKLHLLSLPLLIHLPKKALGTVTAGEFWARREALEKKRSMKNT